MNIYSNKFTVSFSDITENNEISNKGILRLMQEVAGQHSDSVGYGLNDIPKTGLAWIILNWKLKVFSRPKWNTPLTVNTWSRCKSTLFCYRDLEIYDENNNLVAIATSKWILYNVNKKCICRTPDNITEKFPDGNKSVFGEEKFIEKLKEPESIKFVYDYKIQRRDIDTNHHVNNLNYLDYAMESLPENISSNVNFSNVEIMYKHEAKIGDVISVFYSYSENNEHIITIKDEERKKIHSIIKLY